MPEDEVADQARRQTFAKYSWRKPLRPSRLREAMGKNLRTKGTLPLLRFFSILRRWNSKARSLRDSPAFDGGGGVSDS